jgi:hypothetical protein
MTVWIPAGFRDSSKDVLSSTVKHDCGGPGRSVPALLTTAKLHLNSVKPSHGFDNYSLAITVTISNKHVHLIQPKFSQTVSNLKYHTVVGLVHIGVLV